MVELLPTLEPAYPVTLLYLLGLPLYEEFNARPMTKLDAKFALSFWLNDGSKLSPVPYVGLKRGYPLRPTVTGLNLPSILSPFPPTSWSEFLATLDSIFLENLARKSQKKYKHTNRDEQTYRSTIYNMLLHNNTLSDRRISKNNKSESTGTPRDAILHDHSFHYISKILEILSESVFICVPGNPTNEKLARVHFHYALPHTPINPISNHNSFTSKT
ncbi:hypothetical protein CR513_59793, partial [Mucuna pruriens]